MTASISESPIRRYLQVLGPGLITGASDDDPSGIATYSQAGARFGLAMLWVSLVTLPLMSAVQEICDRTALATGQGLGELITRRFGHAWRAIMMFLLGVLIAANALNIAADLLAIGEGAHLLGAGPVSIWALIAGAGITVTVIGGSFHLIARVFKLLCLTLLTYLLIPFAASVHWSAVVRATIIPRVELSRAYVALLVGVLGTTISPYLFFWQSVERVEEMRDEPEGGNAAKPLDARSRKNARRKLNSSRVDVFSGTALSNLVMFAIIVGTAVTLGAHGHRDVPDAAHAAAALRPIAGQFASVMFALGFIGAGVLAIPVLAGAGSSGMAGLIAKPSGYSRSPRQAPFFYLLVAVGTVGGMALSLVGIDPIRLLIIVAVVNGMAAAPFLIVVMMVADNKAIMNDSANGRLARAIGWATAALMAAAAVAVVITL